MSGRFHATTGHARAGHATMGAALAALAVLAAPAAAHDGPPYPILVDEDVGGRTLSVWADPDVGVGTFYLYLPSEREAPSPDLRVDLFVRPADGHLEETRWPCEAAGPDEPYQRVALAEFDVRGPWHVRFALDGPDGRGEHELLVDVTPPGLGRIDVLWFLSPFLAVAFVWIKVVLRRRALEREIAT